STPEEISALMARVRDRVAQRRNSSSPNGKLSTADSPNQDGPNLDGQDDVSHALMAQADFNHSTASALLALEGVLERLGEQLSSVESGLRDQTDRRARDAACVDELSERVRE